ncbi:hypothetical protein O181_038833 [Austropuccinia psidii MF-1]|uniref:Chromatin-remodeling ATPase INO80 n=1 Tax=Austropuccinia psidii MF-1 TaxID=1389203 RepID=A0A9Q3HBD5_9BASI|nr:hypothetical protein [Austropuccinia psidii MF-1]
MSLRNILNHPASPVASAAPSSAVSPPSPSCSISPIPPQTHSPQKMISGLQKQKTSSGPMVKGRRTKRYLDKILGSDGLDDLQAHALPPMTAHPYPEPEDYASSDGMDLDEFAEVWSEPLNQYIISSRRKEHLLQKGYEDWESLKHQELAARLTGWAGDRADQALRLRRSRIEKRRLEEEERLRLEKTRALEEASRIERELAEEDRKQRKRVSIAAAKERNREKRRQAKDEANRRKEEELAKQRVDQAQASALAIEQARHAQLLEEAEIARLEQTRLEAEETQQVHPQISAERKLSQMEWNPSNLESHHQPLVGSKTHWSQATSNHSGSRVNIDDYPIDHFISYDTKSIEIDDGTKTRVPSNLANLLNSPSEHVGGLAKAQNPALSRHPRAPRSSQRIPTGGSIGKRKRGVAEIEGHQATSEDLSLPIHSRSNSIVDENLTFSNHYTSSASTAHAVNLNSHHPTRRTSAGLASQSITNRGKVVGHDAGISSSTIQSQSLPTAILKATGTPFELGPIENRPDLLSQSSSPHLFVIDPAVRRQKNRKLPAWGYDLPYGREPYENISDVLDMSLPARERVVANPKVLANKRWDAIEESRRQIWLAIARKDIPKVIKIQQSATQSRTVYSKRLSALVSREARRIIARTKATKEVQIKAKRMMRELLVYYRSNEKRERESKRKADKEAIERAKKDDEMREVKRQARKLNFLITQTELYSHFVGNKIKTKEAEESADTSAAAPIATSTNGPAILSTSTGGTVELSHITQVAAADKDLTEINFDDDNEFNLQVHAARNAMKAVDAAKQRAQAFDTVAAQKLASTAPVTNETSAKVTGIDIDRDDLNFQNPTMAGDIQVKQPKLLMAELKEYQLKGLNWLANLYEQGINGILADEMGLGKTVQSISLMAYLAEVHNIWGPFLVIAPASTLHNWQQEITRFVPALKPIPYWGSVKDRTILRKFWNRKHLRYDRDAPFHVVITSYQLVVQDEKYFQTLKWQYMILDEAQAIKSSSSTRWKTLLGFHCRNRLLLTGTPIQNSMTELWALLHFIMPQLFDSHEEFSEWFSKDIENSVDKAGGMNEHQLRRLHMILKPFMLRRIKKNVQNELGDKIEIDVACGLTPRQKLMYSRLRENMSISDLVQKATSLSHDDVAVKRLMNLIMQFRKVCNHPELFERADVKAPLSFVSFNSTANVSRDGDLLDCAYATKSLIQLSVPKIAYQDGGMLSVPGPSSRAGFDSKYLDRLMNIWSTPNLLASAPDGSTVPSWARLLDFGLAEVERASQEQTVKRLPWLIRKRREASEICKGADLTESAASSLESTQIFTKSETLPRLIVESGTPQLYEIFNDFQKCSRMSRADVRIYSQKVVAPPIDLYCADRSFELAQQTIRFNPNIRLSFYGLPPPARESYKLSKNFRLTFDGLSLKGLMGVLDQDQISRSFMQVPQLEKLMLDSGKLARLDSLLQELKAGGHRVLIYFQMTRMIDLMEEYLSFRHYRYLRLDGSSTISERRDMVMDWQTRPEIFIFLLSTRAGGLGINLTAADTVIFYDCDWNPSNDQQAMDRAHRLGQKRQVTVYRLITSGTIDERILKLARTKKTVQDAVVGSSSGAMDTGAGEGARPNEVVSLLLDEEELEAGLRAQAARREALKEKQVQSGLRGVRIREERKAAMNQSSSMSLGWSADGLNLEEDDEEAFGFFATQARRTEEIGADLRNGENGSLEGTENDSGKKKGKKRKAKEGGTEEVPKKRSSATSTKPPLKKAKTKAAASGKLGNPPTENQPGLPT